MAVDTLSHTAHHEDPFMPRGLPRRRFFIKLRSWEYWPVYVFNIPILLIWLWYGIRSRDIFFFARTNPGIPTGGFFGESKSAIMQHIPAAYKPITYLLRAAAATDDLEHAFATSGLSFPIIAKPEVGERGWLIQKIHDLHELKQYVAEHPIDLILQTYIDLPLEISIMLYSMPDNRAAAVTSICEKYFLQIEGDGVSTIGELIMEQDRAVLQYEKLRSRFGVRWEEVLPPNDVLILEHVGNHCRGTMFLNRNDQIDDRIESVMLPLLRSMPEVYYGRFDMRVGSWESLRKGEDIRILEFNGTSSDPAHIYQPGYSLIKAYRDMAYHWHIMYRIAQQNKRRGFARAGLKSVLSALMLYFRYKRTN